MPKSVQRCVTSLSVSSKLPSSSRNSMRSRADILPSLCWRSCRCVPPPSCASVSRRLSSASFSSRLIGGNYTQTVKLPHEGTRRIHEGSRVFLCDPSWTLRVSLCGSSSVLFRKLAVLRRIAQLDLAALVLLVGIDDAGIERARVDVQADGALGVFGYVRDFMDGLARIDRDGIRGADLDRIARR